MLPLKNLLHPFSVSNSARSLLLTSILGAAPLQAANLGGINFAGDPALAGNQNLSSTDAAGFFAQKFWQNAAGISGQTGIEIDGGTSIPIFYSGFSATWQGSQPGSAPGTSLLPNSRLMKGSLLSGPAAPATVVISGIPLIYTSGGYGLVVYCDSPANESDVVLKATVETGATRRILYMRDPANLNFSGSFSRAALNSTEDRGAQTPSGNIFIFNGLSASSVALSIEPGESNPSAVAAINAVQIVPASLVQVLTPKIISPLEASATVHQNFSYKIESDLPSASFQATGLPSGLSLNPLTGTISGAPTEPGAFLVELKATNAAGTTTEVLRLAVATSAESDLTLYMVPALVIRGEPGQTHVIEYTNALGNSSNWQICGALTLTSAAEFYVDLSATNSVKRFYRSTLQP